MKKYLLMAVAALIMASCGDSKKDDAKKEYVEFLQGTQQKLEAVTTVEEWQNVAATMTEDATKLVEKYGQETITELNEDADIKKLNEDIKTVTAQKQAEILGTGAQPAEEAAPAEEGAEAPAEEATEEGAEE